MIKFFFIRTTITEFQYQFSAFFTYKNFTLSCDFRIIDKEIIVAYNKSTKKGTFFGTERGEL